MASPSSPNDRPYGSSRAAQILARAIEDLHRREKVSQRQLAKRLGYKQSVLLSHWANGRVPIPIERVAELAEALILDERQFLLAVLSQRHPTFNWDILEDEHTPAFHFVRELEQIAGMPVEDFEAGQKMVMRQAAADGRADLRWLAIHEMPVAALLRKVMPILDQDVIAQMDMHAIEAAIQSSIYRAP